MAATSHTDVFDPQTEAEFARIEADAALAERPATLQGLSIERYLSTPDRWMVMASYRLDDGSAHVQTAASDVTLAEALLALTKEVVYA